MICVYFILFIAAVSAGKYEECGEHATWNECANPCKERSCDEEESMVCPAVCVRQCTCDPGYVKGPDRQCILERDCPPKKECCENEFWNECGSDCEEQCEEPSDPRVCPAVCVAKCSCKSGYVRGPDGNCVAKEECPPKEECCENEFWNECGSDCEEQCEEPSDPRVCPAVCVAKCSCKSGYVRGLDGNCVAKEECPPKEKCCENEFWNECGSDCEEQCEEPRDPRVCPAVCVAKCSCKSGYVRGPDGNCVAKEECPPKEECCENEFWNECGSDCEEQCEEPSDPRVCPAVCVAKCSCKSGYVRGPDGNCVAKEECPPKEECCENEIWNECGSDCEEQCLEPSDPRVCPAVCVAKCSCKSGYVRGPDGNCVAKEKCPPKEECCENEFWNECGSDCEEQCQEPSDPRVCPAVCVAKCSCKSGYVRGPDGNCVAKDECPPKEECCENEFWNECGSDCEEQCEEPRDPRVCPAVCVAKCSCKSGYVRGLDGNCVAKEECPPKEECYENEFWNECGSDCEEQCEEPSDPRVCPAVCVAKCSCKSGYVRGLDGNCVAKEECPPKEECCENEFWNECGSDCEEQCEEPSDPRVCPAVCVAKCSCKSGYVRGLDGNCVAKEECPPKEKCYENEFWNECGSDCEEQCEEPSDPRVCPAVCVAKCSCKSGYVRGPDGNCVAKEECPPKEECCENEFWNECGSDCEEQCQELSDPRVCPAVCVAKCSCKSGYVRGLDGNCVAKEECPPKEECYENEFWNECGSDCEEQCEEPSDPRVCPAVCVAKCSCKSGYVRGLDGNCVAKEECPPKEECCENEFWNECGSDCEEQCEEPSDPRVCPAVCVAKCSCKSGYVRGPDGDCVAKEECPPKEGCSENEFWNECGSDREEQCQEHEAPSSCAAVCVRKCSCKRGYVRGPDGNCIAKEDCPPQHICSDPNAVWSECASYCDQHSCGESDEPKFCPAMCLRNCTCKPGYVTGPDGNCILKEDCPPTCSDPNEVWSDCATGCEEGCEEPEPGTDCSDTGISKCVCKPGFVRGPHGKCIAKDDCPKKCPGINQFWNECGNGCEPRCDKSHLHRACAAVCVKKCSCKRGYFIANNGDCVKEEECDDTCEE